MMRKRLAVSELYASMILLVIISTMGTILYGYTVETTQSYENHFTEKEASESKRIVERLSTISVLWNETGNDLNLTVYNYGEFEASVVEVYVDGAKVENFYAGLDEPIGSMELNEISLQSPTPILDGEQYTIIIVSKRGVTDSYVWKT